MYTEPIFIKSIILNGVFHGQQLLIIVVNVMLHAQLDFHFFLENGSMKVV